MATGFMKKTMVYLGLADDEYEDDPGYEPWPSGSQAQPTARVSVVDDPVDDDTMVSVAPTATIRKLTREEIGGALGSSTTARPAVRSGAIRPIAGTPGDSGVRVVTPTEFTDSKTIADHLMGGQPVIINLQVADTALMRRIIDFCSGAAYVIGGKMERVADKVFLVTPQNVRVSAEERQRLQENGLVRA